MSPLRCSFKNSFVYRGGEMIWMRSDDESWAFVNGKVAVDLGGIHMAFDFIYMLDSLGLSVGDTCALDVFYCERLWDGAFEFGTDIDFLEKTPTRAVVKRVPVIGPQKYSRPQAFRHAVVRLGDIDHAFSLPVSTSDIALELFDVFGRKIASYSRKFSGGTKLIFDAPAPLGKGIYPIRITATDRGGNEVARVSQPYFCVR
jgi:fibro-slime domain-containing protein